MNKVKMKLDDTTNKLNTYKKGKTWEMIPSTGLRSCSPEKDLPVKQEKNKKLWCHDSQTERVWRDGGEMSWDKWIIKH